MDECVWLETLLKKNHFDKSISKVVSVKKENAVSAGNNYASIVQRATLDVILSSGNKSKISLIIKKEHEDEGKVKALEEFSVFKVETKVYTDILSKYDQVMNEYQDTNDTLWCDIIGYKAYNLIVFEDLKKKNFRLGDRTGLLDKNHALLVMNGLGRFHALGHVLLQKGLINKSDLNPYYMEDPKPVILQMLIGGLRQLCTVMKNDWSPEWNEIAERLSKQESVIVDKQVKLFEVQEDTFMTVCHGDCWTCNMMFKYCPYDDSVPIAVKFLDFQISHSQSYAFDVMYFIFTSVRSEVRRNFWNELISEYQKTLLTTLTFYGITENIPTIENITNEIKRLEYYGLVLHLLFLPIMSTEAKDAFIIENLLDDRDGMEAYNPDMFRSDTYKNEVQFDLKKWFEDGLF